MVEANKKTGNYTYGSVAYDIEPEIRRKQQVHKQNSKKSNKKKFILMGRIFVVFVLSFLLVYRFTLVMKLTYEIRNVKTQIAQINNNNENLRIDLAVFSNIKTIEKTAVDKCGMIVPPISDVKYVDVTPLTLSDEKYDKSTYQMIQKLLGLLY